MKNFLSILLVATMLFSLVACNKNEPDIENNPNDTNLTEWQKMYEIAIQEYINADVFFSSVYIGDVDGDGIPTVAFSTNPYYYKTPDVIMNCVNGRIAEITDFETEDSGSAVMETYCFVDGTNDIVYRTYGNTTGTFGANEFQAIYSIVESGEYEVVSEKEFELSKELSEKYNNMLASGDTDVAEYQKAILSQMDDEVKTVTGSNASFLEYQSVARDFTVASEAEFDLNMKNAVQYINDMLDINLTLEANDKNINNETDSKELFNAENYIGEWGSDYFGCGLYGETITIHSADDNKIIYSIFYYRLGGVDYQEATVNSDGTADIRGTYEHLYIDGKMIFENNQIKLVVEDTNINGVECDSSVFERLKNAPQYRMKKALANYIDDWDKATIEEKSFAGRELFWDIMKYQPELSWYDDMFEIRMFNETISHDADKVTASYEVVEISDMSKGKRIGLVVVIEKDSVQFKVLSEIDRTEICIQTYDWNGEQITDGYLDDNMTLYEAVFQNS